MTDGYFALMNIRLTSGRTFGARDRFSAPQINYVARPQAIWLPDGDNVLWREVVGIVEDIQFHAVGEAPACTRSSRGHSRAREGRGS